MNGECSICNGSGRITVLAYRPAAHRSRLTRTRSGRFATRTKTSKQAKPARFIVRCPACHRTALHYGNEAKEKIAVREI